MTLKELGLYCQDAKWRPCFLHKAALFSVADSSLFRLRVESLGRRPLCSLGCAEILQSGSLLDTIPLHFCHNRH